jgi:asparagine synthetase B (glutamine-hydrolysing)
LYFMDAPNGPLLQEELKRIYQMLVHVNLHRTDRMTMAHGLEARVPFSRYEIYRIGHDHFSHAQNW